MKKSQISFKLPEGVRPKHGALYFVSSYKDCTQNKWKYVWTRLSRISAGEAEMLRALAKLKAIPTQTNFLPVLEQYKMEIPPSESFAVRKETDRMLEIIGEAFQDFNIQQIEAADIIDFLDQFKGKPSASRQYKSKLSVFFRWAIGKRMRKDNPCREVWLTKGQKKKPLRWNAESFHAIRKAMGRQEYKNGRMMQAYMDLSFLLYQRPTEIRLIERSQIRGEFIYFYPSKTRGSSGVELEVEITPSIRDALDRAATESRRMKTVCPYIIHTSAGTAYTRSGINSAFRRAARLAGYNDVKGFNPKALRPFAATNAKRAGYSLEELQDGLGHENISTTEGYVRKNAIRRSKVRLELPEEPSSETLSETVPNKKAPALRK